MCAGSLCCLAPQAHAITLSPYMGGDSLQPFLDDATRGSFILCKTSNPGSNDLQILPVAGAATVYEEVARLAQDRWNSNGNVGLVVGATDKNREHVPYRQSKLTNLLKNSIGGNCYTILVANVWPEASHLEETLSTLRFATRMK